MIFVDTNFFYPSILGPTSQEPTQAESATKTASRSKVEGGLLRARVRSKVASQQLLTSLRRKAIVSATNRKLASIRKATPSSQD